MSEQQESELLRKALNDRLELERFQQQQTPEVSKEEESHPVVKSKEAELMDMLHERDAQIKRINKGAYFNPANDPVYTHLYMQLRAEQQRKVDQ